MSTYIAPLPDMRFVLQELIGLDEIAELPGLKKSPPIWSTPYWTKLASSRATYWLRSTNRATPRAVGSRTMS